MNRDNDRIEETELLENTEIKRSTRVLLAERYKMLLLRQEAERRLLRGLRLALELLPPGPTRKAIAENIQQYTAEHASRIEHLAQILVKESEKAGQHK